MNIHHLEWSGLRLVLVLLALIFGHASSHAEERRGDPNNFMVLFDREERLNGERAGTNNPKFRDAFDKRLEELSQQLPGKPKVVRVWWYKVTSNGCSVAIHTPAPDGTSEALIKLLKKESYVRYIELSTVVELDD